MRLLNSTESKDDEAYIFFFFCFGRSILNNIRRKEAACNFMLLQIVSCLAHMNWFNWGSDAPQEKETVMAYTTRYSES